MQQKSFKQFEKQRAQNHAKLSKNMSLLMNVNPYWDIMKFEFINNIRIEKLQASSLIHSKSILKQIIVYQQQHRPILKNDTLKKNQKKYICKLKNPPLTDDQRELIEKLQQEGFKSSVISGILGVSTSQVRQNRIRLKICKSKEEINITKRQQLWLKEQGSSQSSSILFNARNFLSSLQVQFPKQKLSITQFRKVLRQCNIRYRIPSLKPLSFFYKTGRDEGTKKFISQICGYLSYEYKVIFIDECSLGNISKSSHKQLHILGTFKESTQRISSFKYLIGSIGDDYFLQYQLISGTGKAYIFQDFILQIIKKAKDHQKDKRFVLIMDNCSIHKSKQIEQIFDRVPCIFTPTYRPEFNAIEHMFGWLKRGLVAAQTTSTKSLILFHKSQYQIGVKAYINRCFRNWIICDKYLILLYSQIEDLSVIVIQYLQIHNQKDQEEQQPIANSSLMLNKILNSYNYLASCKTCNQVIPISTINQLIVHQFKCNQQANFDLINNPINEQQQSMLLVKQLNQENEQNHQNKKFKKGKIIDQFLNVGKLSKGSLDVYKPALLKLFRHLDDANLMNLSTNQLQQIVRYQCKSINQVNPINRIRKQMHLNDSLELITTIKQQKRVLKENILKRPHRSWDLQLLQLFLDELIRYQRGILAFRIYILYELAARISELAQITFKMVIDGVIVYTPKKQQKQGNQAERKFKLSESVISLAKEVRIYSISIDSTLNIGFNKQIIHSQSFHKQLHFALNLIKEQNKNQEIGFQQLLEYIQYHDLRYTKLTEMHKCGINEKVIQSFVKHKSIKTTQRYIRADDNDFVDLSNLSSNQQDQQFQKYLDQQEGYI